jgi:hypothetical protein
MDAMKWQQMQFLAVGHKNWFFFCVPAKTVLFTKDEIDALSL